MEQLGTHWKQEDEFLNREEAWPASLFPDAEYRYFRDCGCLVCALAVMLRNCGAETQADERLFNPWVLNGRLIACGAFSSSADLELDDIGRLYPLEYVGAVPYSRKALAEVAASASPCLVTVPGNKAARHFLALLRIIEDDAIVYDPLVGETRLSSYAQVCELRVFRKR